MPTPLLNFVNAVFGTLGDCEFRVSSTWPQIERECEYGVQFAHFSEEVICGVRIVRCSCGWTFWHDGDSREDLMDFVAYLHVLRNAHGARGPHGEESSAWMSYAPTEYTTVAADLLNCGIPLLDRFCTVQALLGALDDGAPIFLGDEVVEPRMLFGLEPGWQDVNIGVSWERVGRKEEAENAYRCALAHFASRQADWCKNAQADVARRLHRLNTEA